MLLVFFAGWTGHQLGGYRGARWSAFAAAALASTPVLGTWEVNGELLAAPLVMLSCALTLAAARHHWRPVGQAASAFGAGLTGASAVLVKQNLADGLVFAVALVSTAALTRTWPRGVVVRIVIAGAVGVLLPLGATMLWAGIWAPGLGALWSTLYGFRAAVLPPMRCA